MSAGGNTEARFQAGTVQLDFDGDGLLDATIRFTGLVSDNQIDGNDFLFV